jgi:hypothetical protein
VKPPPSRGSSLKDSRRDRPRGNRQDRQVRRARQGRQERLARRARREARDPPRARRRQGLRQDLRAAPVGRAQVRHRPAARPVDPARVR